MKSVGEIRNFRINLTKLFEYDFRIKELATSNGVCTDLSCSDSLRIFDIKNENLTVANLTRLRGFRNRFYHSFGKGFRYHHLDFDLRQKTDFVLCTTVDLGLPLLPPETFDFRNRKPLYAKLRERLAHIIEFERLDNGHNQLHASVPLGYRAPLLPARAWMYPRTMPTFLPMGALSSARQRRDGLKSFRLG